MVYIRRLYSIECIGTETFFEEFNEDAAANLHRNRQEVEADIRMATTWPGRYSMAWLSKHVTQTRLRKCLKRKCMEYVRYRKIKK